MNYQFQQRDAKVVIFEHPVNPTSLIKFTRILAPKTVDKLKLLNVRNEVAVTRQHDPRAEACTDCSGVKEPISARLILSGSDQSGAEIKKMWKTLRKAVDSQIDVMIRGSQPGSDIILEIDPTL